MADSNEPPYSADPPEEFFLRHLDLIERIARFVARRSKLPAAETDDFVSFVKEKLLEDGYRRIRAYRGLCPPKPFFAVTIGRLGKDFLDRIWQRWRPRAEVQRLGPVAVLLDQLVNREGLPFEEACATLRSRHGVTTPKAELERIFALLPERVRRRLVGEEDLVNHPAKEPTPEERAMSRERERKRRLDLAALNKITAGLPPEDRILIRLLYGEGHSIADIARKLEIDQKSLYRRRDKILRLLREALSMNGSGED